MNEVALFAWLLSWTLRATALLCVVWVATRFARSAAHRHVLWTVGIIGTIALPLIAVAGPSLDMPLLPGESLSLIHI